ncbi:MAG: CPBP family intramembrane metalloprotease [Methanophagales archaeon]|nr:CPBP family intramembrane metalloprotease [Methanophagales archaeon]
MLVQEIVNTISQLLLATLIPFIVYLAKHKTNKGFLEYVGLYNINERKVLLYSGLFAIISFILMVGPMILFLRSGALKSDLFVQAALKQQGLNLQSIITLFIMAIFKTSLSEEIFFRGFIGKRLINKFGFNTGNSTQAVLFGLVHSILGFQMGTTNLLILVASTAVVGYLLGYLVEKIGNGSIVPSWITHASSNCISFYIFAFVVST